MYTSRCSCNQTNTVRLVESAPDAGKDNQEYRVIIEDGVIKSEETAAVIKIVLPQFVYEELSYYIII